MKTRSCSLTILCSGLLGCAVYEPLPLDTSAELTARLQELATPADPVSLPAAVRWMLLHNPRIVAATGVWRTRQARARVATPLANPTIGIGPVYLSGGTWGLEAALGWALPAFGRRAAADDHRTALAEAARVEALAVAREEYLGLRADLLAVARLVDREALAAANAEVLGGIVEGQRRLGANATISALDLRLLELEWLELVSQRHGAAAAVAAGRSGPALRCGVGIERIAELPLQVRPALPAALPPLARLQDLVAEHPQLVRLWARYQAAEQELRLAVRGQYPDLELGGSLEREGGDNRLALPLGISLPLFDRNQGPIAAARAAREAVRAEFTATLRRLLQDIRARRAALAEQHRRYRAFVAAARGSVTAARRLIDSGVGSGQLDASARALALRKVFAAELALLDARADLYDAWVRLEAACGAPLLEFPGQPDAPSGLPDGAEVRR